MKALQSVTRLIVVLLAVAQGAAHAADWPLHRADAARSGYTPGELDGPLAAAWVHRALPPRPAWPASERMPFDRGYQVVVADGRLFFGSSADGRVVALDAADGAVRWKFATDGPVRFAPAVWRDRLLVGSDDGFLYCLATADGRLLWKRRGGPNPQLVVGNGRIVSRWPVRGGPVVADDVVYFGAGIWPTEGFYLHALDARSGAPRWVNGETGTLRMPQPHSGAVAESGVAAQGYLAVSAATLLVPTGRAVPAVFDRPDGRLRYFHLQKFGSRGHYLGHSEAVAAGDAHFNSGVAFQTDDGTLLGKLGWTAIATPPGQIVAAREGRLEALRWTADRSPPSQGAEPPVEPLVEPGDGSRPSIPGGLSGDKADGADAPRALERLWSVEKVGDARSLIVAGESIVCGTPGRVTLFAPTGDKAGRPQRSQSWEVEGTPVGLAAAAGRLYATTDRGAIHCFAPHSAPAAASEAPTHEAPLAKRAPGDESPSRGEARPAVAPVDEDAAADAAADRAAEAIVSRSGITAGYCVDLGCGDGRLAMALARRTELQIEAVEADPELVEAARRRLDAAGLYGTRVIVRAGDPVATHLPRYLADLVVSGRTLAAAPPGAVWREAHRLQRPCGGVRCFGQAATLRVDVRGPLEGAGRWTHQYATPANPVCSDDTAIRGPLEVLWYTDVDIRTPQRGPAPLVADGRIIVEGFDAVGAVSAYNGRLLWKHSLPGILAAYRGSHWGTATAGSNICIDETSVFVAEPRRVLRLDIASGKQTGEFPAPAGDDGKPGTWGYLACDAGTNRLVGSLAIPEFNGRLKFPESDMSRVLSESSALFALDARSGAPKWMHKAKHAIRHNAVAIGSGRVHLIDRRLARFDIGPAESYAHPPGELITLDLTDGKVLWRKQEGIYGTALALSEAHDVLVMSYQKWRWSPPSERGGRLSAYRASTGEKLWDATGDYTTRLVLNDRTIYAEGGAWDLLTGEPRPFALERTYGCGQLSACRDLLFLRSATLAYLDLKRTDGLRSFGGARLGCWINAIPAGGLVLVPEATPRCTCSYLNKTWFALAGPEIEGFDAEDRDSKGVSVPGSHAEGSAAPVPKGGQDSTRLGPGARKVDAKP